MKASNEKRLIKALKQNPEIDEAYVLYAAFCLREYKEEWQDEKYLDVMSSHLYSISQCIGEQKNPDTCFIGYDFYVSLLAQVVDLDYEHFPFLTNEREFINALCAASATILRMYMEHVTVHDILAWLEMGVGYEREMHDVRLAYRYLVNRGVKVNDIDFALKDAQKPDMDQYREEGEKFCQYMKEYFHDSIDQFLKASIDDEDKQKYYLDVLHDDMDFFCDMFERCFALIGIIPEGIDIQKMMSSLKRAKELFGMVVKLMPDNVQERVKDHDIENVSFMCFLFGIMSAKISNVKQGVIYTEMLR